jgi:hypothetical protein
MPQSFTHGGSIEAAPLNSAHEVNKIVRKFAAEVIKNTFAGEMSREQFVQWIEERVKALSRLFLGDFTMEAHQYQRGIWNTPENLGLFLQQYLPGSVSQHDTVTVLLNQLATDAMKIVKNTQLSESVSKQKLETACATTRDLLLGLGHQTLQ